MAQELCKRYKLPTPAIKFKRRTTKVWWDGECAGNSITLISPDSRNLWCLLHELSHYIVDQYGYSNMAGHGPVWLGTYLCLLNATYVLPMCASLPSARTAGLKFRDPDLCAPKTLKRYLQR